MTPNGIGVCCSDGKVGRAEIPASSDSRKQIYLQAYISQCTRLDNALHGLKVTFNSALIIRQREGAESSCCSFTAFRPSVLQTQCLKLHHSLVQELFQPNTVNRSMPPALRQHLYSSRRQLPCNILFGCHHRPIVQALN